MRTARTGSLFCLSALVDGRENQVVVTVGLALEVHGLRLEVYARRSSHDDVAVFLAAQHLPNGRRDVPGREGCSRHLVEQRLKQVMVVAIDEDHLSLGMLEGLGRSDSPEAASDDGNPRDVLSHVVHQTTITPPALRASPSRNQTAD